MTVTAKMLQKTVNVTACRESDTLLRVVDDRVNNAIIVRVGDREATISHHDAGEIILSLFGIICNGSSAK